MNFGAIIRTAYFMGVRQIFVRDQGTCRLSPVVSKASAGVLEVLPIQMVDNVAEFMKVTSKFTYLEITKSYMRVFRGREASEGGKGSRLKADDDKCQNFFIETERI